MYSQLEDIHTWYDNKYTYGSIILLFIAAIVFIILGATMTVDWWFPSIAIGVALIVIAVPCTYVTR
jgi:cation transport ATPase